MSLTTLPRGIPQVPWMGGTGGRARGDRRRRLRRQDELRSLLVAPPTLPPLPLPRTLCPLLLLGRSGLVMGWEDRGEAMGEGRGRKGGRMGEGEGGGEGGGDGELGVCVRACVRDGVRDGVRACVRAWRRAWRRACLRACVRACVRPVACSESSLAQPANAMPCHRNCAGASTPGSVISVLRRRGSRPLARTPWPKPLPQGHATFGWPHGTWARQMRSHLDRSPTRTWCGT